MQQFQRKFFDTEDRFTVIGSGEIGGKAHGLLRIKDALREQFTDGTFGGISIDIPRLAVIATDMFDIFMTQNKLYDIALSNASDERIAHHFQRAELPVNLVGDLRALIGQVNVPLAVRSSSMLEDAMYEPFAGIYGTKMIPNNQPDSDSRFRRLVEAVKFVYASTFFQEAKDYFSATGHKIESEKMAVIIQEVVGIRHGNRFYPEISGVARSYNFYPMGRAKPEDGVLDLALGLGKTIVDGGKAWTVSPAFPKTKPPCASPRDMVKQSQNLFWAVNMGKPPAFDPIKEAEYMIQSDLKDAEYDGTLRYIVSTYDINADRINMGMDGYGPRIVDFSFILELEILPLTKLIKTLLPLCETIAEAEVEVEFAMTIQSSPRLAARFGLLQVRPMVVSHDRIDVTEEDLTGEHVLLASDKVLGNGVLNTIQDIVYVKPECFNAKNTPLIAGEVQIINRSLTQTKTPYVLIGFGRWGSSDPWLGIPANWGQISGAKVIVESSLPEMFVELSQGSHFFHNLTSFQVSYFAVSHLGPYTIDWNWLNSLETIAETEFVRHVRTAGPLTVKVDGRSGKGVIYR